MKILSKLRHLLYRLRAMHRSTRTPLQAAVDVVDTDTETWPDNIIQLDLWRDL